MSHEFRRSETADFPKNKNIIKIATKIRLPPEHMWEIETGKKKLSVFYKGPPAPSQKEGEEGGRDG